MRRILTFKHLPVNVAVVFALLNYGQLFGQTCIPITVVANCQTGVTENFDGDASISTSGFSGDFTLLGTTDRFLQSTEYPNNTTAVKTLLSNTWKTSLHGPTIYSEETLWKALTSAYNYMLSSLI